MMPVRLVALDHGPDIILDRALVVVGRHPSCDTRLDSLRVSRRHCCVTRENGELLVRDLGSTNGIKINGEKVEIGLIRPGDELTIAHFRFRVDDDGDGSDDGDGDGPDWRLPVWPRHSISDLLSQRSRTFFFSLN